MKDRAERRRARLRDRQAPRFALFGETLLVGIVVLVASIPLFTVVPAVTAGARHLRRHAVGEGDSIRVLLADLWLAVRRLWMLGLAALALAVFLFLDAWALGGMHVPGGQVIVVVPWAVGVAASVVLLRFTGGWMPDAGVRAQLRRAAGESLADLTGSALLLLAVGAAVVVIWMFPAFLLVAGGLLSLAAYGVDARLEALAE